MQNGITDATEMESLTEDIANLFEKMVPSPSDEKHAFGAGSQKHNAASDLREEIHGLIQKFEEKVRSGEYYDLSVLK